MIPRIIHQIWDRGEPPEEFRRAAESWSKQNPEWTYRLWRQPEMDALVADAYPQLLALYQSYPDFIQRIDAVRYMILHRFGGVYADMDVECRRSFENLRAHAVFLPKTEPLGLSCDLMGGEAGSQFFAFLLDRLEPARQRFPRGLVPRHFRVLLTTGSLFVTMGARAYDKADDIYALPPSLYGATGDPAAYVAHLPGSTWHKWDSDLFVFVFAHIKWIGGALTALVGGWLLWR